MLAEKKTAMHSLIVAWYRNDVRRLQSGLVARFNMLVEI